MQRTPAKQIPLQTKTRAMTAADAAAATVTSENFNQEKQPGTVELDNSGTVNQTNTDMTIVNFESSADASHLATDDLSTVAVSQPILLDMMSTLNETQSQLEVERQSRKELQTNLTTELRTRDAEVIESRRTNERLQAQLHAREAEAIENRRTIEGLQAEQFSIQQQFTQIQQRLNQMSQNTIFNTQTPNIDTLGNRLDSNSRTNISTHVLDSVVPVNLALGYNLKPDTYDGTTPLSEYLNQFNLIAKANNWNDDKKTIALAASLRDKAKSVLISFKNADTLDWETLLERLEVRFGEHFGSNSYSLFQNRRQRPGEDLQSLAADIVKLTALAYPECPLEVQDKIACSQFIIGIYNIEVRKILQLERITSLKVAVARAVEVKNIEDQNRYSNSQRNTRNSQSSQNSLGRKDNNGGKEEKQNQPFNHQEWLKNLECWNCHKKGHTSSRCLNQGN